VFSLPRRGVPPGHIGGGEANALFPGALGEAGEALGLVAVNLTVAGHSFNNPEFIRLLVPEQDVGHRVAEVDRDAGFLQGLLLLGCDALTVCGVNVEDLEPRRKLGT